MTRQRFIVSFIALALCSISAWCQGLSRLSEGVEVFTEAQYSCSNGTTPLWLNANKYGMSSLESQNGYLRVGASRSNQNDSLRKWRIGYGIDLALAAKYTSTIVANEAYADFSFMKATITVGAKKRTSPYTTQEMSSGALLYGWNSRPIPQATLDIDWFSFPWTEGWWKWKVHGSYGFTTDGKWQKSVAPETEHYTGNVLYHEKSLYWKFGKENHESVPLTFELGLQFASVFGGTTYNYSGRVFTERTDIKHPVNFKAFINALTCTGSDENDGSSKNTAGNHVGSWIGRLKWHGTDWTAALRFERMFEDQSMMFIQYGWYDHLVGADFTLPRNPYISAVTIEHMSTRDQSGAVMHDEAVNIPDKMNGMDNYYNHSIYSGYQHWGQANGNPLLTSPVYNENGSLVFSNNRLTAWHFGFAGEPCDWLNWKAFATFTRNWGTYDWPLEDPTNQQYFLLEANAHPARFEGWQATVGLGLDHGKLVGNNFGVQLTVRKTFKL